MIVRRVVEELEARLQPPPGAASPSAAKGKLELKRYGDDRRRMKIKCRGLALADGAAVELLNGKTVVALLEVRNGRAEIDEERDAGADAPALAVGDTVDLCHRGTVLLSGRLYLD